MYLYQHLLKYKLNVLIIQQLHEHNPMGSNYSHIVIVSSETSWYRKVFELQKVNQHFLLLWLVTVVCICWEWLKELKDLETNFHDNHTLHNICSFNNQSTYILGTKESKLMYWSVQKSQKNNSRQPIPKSLKVIYS